MAILADIKRSLSQLMAAFSVIAFLGGVFIMSPTGRFGSFLIMAITALAPLVLGSRKLRIFGAIAFAVGVIGTILLFGAFAVDPYFIRNKLR